MVPRAERVPQVTHFAKAGLLCREGEAFLTRQFLHSWKPQSSTQSRRTHETERSKELSPEQTEALNPLWGKLVPVDRDVHKSSPA